MDEFKGRFASRIAFQRALARLQGVASKMPFGSDSYQHSYRELPVGAYFAGLVESGQPGDRMLLLRPRLVFAPTW